MTTSPPASVAVGGGAAGPSSGLPWIADWRDAWLANPGRLLRAVGAREAGRLGPAGAPVAPALAGAACVNEQIAAEVRRWRPRRQVEVVPNGAAFEDRRGLSAVPTRG